MDESEVTTSTLGINTSPRKRKLMHFKNVAKDFYLKIFFNCREFSMRVGGSHLDECHLHE